MKRSSFVAHEWMSTVLSLRPPAKLTAMETLSSASVLLCSEYVDGLMLHYVGHLPRMTKMTYVPHSDGEYLLR